MLPTENLTAVVVVEHSWQHVEAGQKLEIISYGLHALEWYVCLLECMYWCMFVCMCVLLV